MDILPNYLEVLQLDARQRFLASIKTCRQDADVIKAQANVTGTKHRMRLESGNLQEKIKLLMHDYTPETLKIIALGFIVKIDAEGSLTALASSNLPSSALA